MANAHDHTRGSQCAWCLVLGHTGSVCVCVCVYTGRGVTFIQAEASLSYRKRRHFAYRKRRHFLSFIKIIDLGGLT
jgi:hypothetical protein